MKTLIENIKVLVNEQRDLKNQRKTVKIEGERTMEPWKATYKHAENRILLREMYVALGLMRGREIEQIEPGSKTPINMNNVNKLIEKHGTLVPLSS